MEKLACANHSVLTWHHPRFEEFTLRFHLFICPKRKGFRPPIVPFSVTRMILHEMGGIDVEKTLDWMKERSACGDDLEVLDDIIGGYFDRVDHGEIAPWDGQHRHEV